MEQHAVNDLVVRFCNVNGTGSASANNIFAKAIYRMGIIITNANGKKASHSNSERLRYLPATLLRGVELNLVALSIVFSSRRNPSC